MKSAPSCCQSHSGGGVGFSGCLGSWGWCLWQVVHASTSCSMSLLMPGQYTQCLALYWHLDVPKCPWWICSKTFFLSPGGMMIASPCRISPSSIVSESHCPWYGHHMLLEHPWYHLAIQQWLCLQGHLAVGHPWLRVGNLVSSQHQCIHGWQRCLGESLVYLQVSILIRCLLKPFPLLGDTWLWNHNPEVRVISSVDILGHLPGSL